MKVQIIFSFLFLSLSSYGVSSKKNYFSTVEYVVTKMSKQSIDIGIGKKKDNKRYDVKCTMDFVSNGALVHSNGNFVGGSCTNAKRHTPFLGPSEVSNPGGNFFNKYVKEGFQNGVLVIQKNGTNRLCSSSEINCAPSSCEGIDFAIQNGPILVKDNVNPHNSQSISRKTRSGMGFGGNNIIHIYSKTPATFWEMGEIFIKHGASNAIYLDGENVYAGVINNNDDEIYGNLHEDAYYLQFYNCDSIKNPIESKASTIGI